LSTVRQMWRTKYPESFREVSQRLMMKAGLPEEKYPIEVRRALELRYRPQRYNILGRQWRIHMRILRRTHE
jgi:hypothetical protein